MLAVGYVKQLTFSKNSSGIHAWIQKVLPEGVQLGQRFFVGFFDEGREDPNEGIQLPL